MEKKFLYCVCAMLLSLSREGVPQAEANFYPNASFGIASWYSESDPGINQRTANGEIFEDSKHTCASWDFPFGTHLRVTHLTNGKTVVCRVNDRGPAKRLGRVIDLTRGTFQKIAPLRAGLIPVKVEVIGPQNP